MHCPKCGLLLVITKDSELFACSLCGFKRPVAWWDMLQLDINTEIKWPELETVVEVPEELSGKHETPWGD